ncbi:MAG TPA: tetratricopeptide repeat protein [Pyrinomonadaceae bacterium]|nr:tetratricopeptide repeat protein [Pyrinomonadaceae bacterium]
MIAGTGWRGLLYFFQSEYEQAEEALAESLSLSSELRDGFMALFCLYFLGLTRANLGRISEALASFDEAFEMARRNGDRNQSPKIPNAVGWIHRELQDFDHAIEHDRAGVEVARRHQVLEAEINSVINLSCDYMHTREGEETLPALREAKALLERDEWLRWRFNIRYQASRCEYLLSQGDLEPAEECAQRLLEMASHYEARKYIATAHKLLAEIAIASGDSGRADAELNAALNVLRNHPAPIVAWRIYAALGRLRLQLGDGKSARNAFAQATTIINSMGANTSNERLRATFMNSPVVREILDRSSEGFIKAKL